MDQLTELPRRETAAEYARKKRVRCIIYTGIEVTLAHRTKKCGCEIKRKIDTEVHDKSRVFMQ